MENNRAVGMFFGKLLHTFSVPVHAMYRVCFQLSVILFPRTFSLLKSKEIVNVRQDKPLPRSLTTASYDMQLWTFTYLFSDLRFLITNYYIDAHDGTTSLIIFYRKIEGSLIVPISYFD